MLLGTICAVGFALVGVGFWLGYAAAYDTAYLRGRADTVDEQIEAAISLRDLGARVMRRPRLFDFEQDAS